MKISKNNIINALNIGEQAKRLLEGCDYQIKAHSVFDHAINFIAKENWIIAVLPDGFSKGPQTIIIKCKDFQVLKPLITIDSIWDLNELINIKNAKIIEGKDIVQLSINDMERLKINATYFQKLLNDKGNKVGLLGEDNIYSQHASTSLKAFSTHFQQLELKEAGLQLSQLVGLGPGLTPSGDDFILGIFASLHFSGFNKIYGMKLVETTIKNAVNRTNLISFNMIRQGSMGGFIKWVENMVIALMLGDTQQVNDKFHNIIMIGSSSGSDISAGILYGTREILKLYRH